jgi:hypothetical protein
MKLLLLLLAFALRIFLLLRHPCRWHARGCQLMLMPRTVVRGKSPAAADDFAVAADIAAAEAGNAVDICKRFCCVGYRCPAAGYRRCRCAPHTEVGDTTPDFWMLPRRS